MLERLVLTLEVVEVRRRDAEAGKAKLGRALQEHDQPVRLRIRQRIEEHAVDHAEDGGVGPDTQGQGQHREKGRSWIADQGAHAEAYVFPDVFQGTSGKAGALRGRRRGLAAYQEMGSG